MTTTLSILAAIITIWMLIFLFAVCLGRGSSEADQKISELRKKPVDSNTGSKS
jgi:hypothetical protein